MPEAQKGNHCQIELATGFDRHRWRRHRQRFNEFRKKKEFQAAT
jgi:hypothetical protein